ncbi:MAG: NAD-dependent epimerase/dehydratase family protein [Opitutaceae bacterium]
MESTFKDRTIGVTGGLGLIGSFLCEELLDAGARVVLVDDESKGSWKYIPHLKDRVDFRKGSLENPAFAKEALEGCTSVFHLASRAYGVGFSQKNNFEMFRFNDLVNTNVLDAIATHKVDQALVVSSSCVYSDEGPTPMPDSIPFSGEPERVNWGYGWAKRILEQKAVIYQKETGIPITVVRPFNIYGERYNWVGDSSQAIPMLVKRILDGENPVLIWGTGNQRRNYIHALDCSRVMMRLLENGYFERPVNVGREETVSVRDLVSRIAKEAGLEIAIITDRTKPEGRFIKSADSKLLSAALGDDFEWKVGIREGLRRMIDWHGETFPKEAAGAPAAT